MPLPIPSTRDKSAGEATVDFTDPSASSANPNPKLNAGAIARERPQLDAETRDLLRLRLRAVAIVLLVATCAFALREVLGGLPSQSIMFEQFGVLEPALIASIVVLTRKKNLSLRGLRWLEFAIFGLMTAHVVTINWQILLIQSRANDSAGAGAFLQSLTSDFVLLIMTYGFFIPNTWRRALAVVSAIAAAPLVAGLFLAASRPEIREFLRPLLTSFEISGDLLTMAIAIVTAVIGATMVHSMRRESFEARQLNQYQLGERLGVGGMGEVYLAEHRLLKRPCAIKLIRPGQGADPKVLQRFEREVRATARLSHPNTVEIYDYGRAADGSFFYVMEYLPGLSFDDLVRRFGPLPAGRAIFLLRQACAALAEAHGFGLIHRDIKPANLFAAKRGGLDDFVKLLDFGLVKPLATLDGELSQDIALAGTPVYMAPEQARGDSGIDARCDIYGVGAVGYYLLTGRPPFAGANPLEVIAALLRDKPLPPSRLCAETPIDLEGVVLRCLAKNPDDRFQSAGELDDALESCAAADQWNSATAAQWWSEHRSTASASPR